MQNFCVTYLSKQNDKISFFSAPAVFVAVWFWSCWQSKDSTYVACTPISSYFMLINIIIIEHPHTDTDCFQFVWECLQPVSRCGCSFHSRWFFNDSTLFFSMRTRGSACRDQLNIVLLYHFVLKTTCMLPCTYHTYKCSIGLLILLQKAAWDCTPREQVHELKGV